MVKASIPDRYYEQKLVQGSITPTWDYMTDTEANAVVNGRYRGDGRRLDQWISDEPMGIILDRRGGLTVPWVWPRLIDFEALVEWFKSRLEGRW